MRMEILCWLVETHRWKDVLKSVKMKYGALSVIPCGHPMKEESLAGSLDTHNLVH